MELTRTCMSRAVRFLYKSAGCRFRNGASDRSGQAMVEYVITAGILISTVAILSVFLYTFKEYAGRVLDLVASEYP